MITNPSTAPHRAHGQPVHDVVLGVQVDRVRYQVQLWSSDLKALEDHKCRSSGHPERMKLSWARWHMSHSAWYVTHSTTAPQA